MLLDANIGAGIVFIGAFFLFLVVLIPIVTLGIVFIAVAISKNKKSKKMEPQAAVKESEEAVDNKGDEV